MASGSGAGHQLGNATETNTFELQYSAEIERHLPESPAQMVLPFQSTKPDLRLTTNRGWLVGFPSDVQDALANSAYFCSPWEPPYTAWVVMLGFMYVQSKERRLIYRSMWENCSEGLIRVHKEAEEKRRTTSFAPEPGTNHHWDLGDYTGRTGSPRRRLRLAIN